MRALVPRLTVPPVSFFELEREHPLGVRPRERPLARACATLTLAPPPIATVPRLEQAGHEIIMQVEGDERCAAVLREQFPRARLDRHLPSLLELPAETEVLAATLPWPEEGDEDAKERSGVEESWRPASRAAALEEHEHFFRLLATDDWFAQEKALFCLAKVIEHRPKKDMGLAAVAAACGGGAPSDSGAASAAEPMGAAAQTMVQLTQWLCAQLARPSHASRALPAVVSALAVLLAVREARALVTHSGGVRLLGDATTRFAPDPRDPEPAPHDVQALYESTLCLWFLTFHPPATREMARCA